MDTRTGEIKDLEDVKKLPESKQKWFKKIPDHLVSIMKTMNRADRRKYYRENKEEFGGKARLKLR